MKKAIGILALSIMLAAGTSVRADVAVIVNSSVPLTSIDNVTLLNLFSGDVRTWENGDPVVVLELKPRTETKNLFYDYLGKSSSRMKSIWMKRMLAGEGNPPEALESEDDVLRKVASTPGAIGYVSVPTATRENGNVTTLLVIDSSGQ